MSGISQSSAQRKWEGDNLYFGHIPKSNEKTLEWAECQRIGVCLWRTVKANLTNNGNVTLILFHFLFYRHQTDNSRLISISVVSVTLRSCTKKLFSGNHLTKRTSNYCLTILDKRMFMKTYFLCFAVFCDI